MTTPDAPGSPGPGPNGPGPNGSGPDGSQSPAGPVLRTEPRPFWVHVAVDALIAFCATVFLLWLFGAPLWLMIALAWAIGLAAAPFTRQWEAAQLAERRAGPDQS